MSRLARRRVELWVEARGGTAAVNPIMRALLADLGAAGATVSTRVLDWEIVDPCSGAATRMPDLVLLKAATTLALSVAVADEARGVRFLNDARATWRAHDKAATVARLTAAGLPVPTTFLLEPTPDGIAPPPGSRGAWVAKPTRGVHGHGVTVHPTFPRSLLGPTSSNGTDTYVVDDGTRLIQQRIGGDDPDLKVYVAGERLFAGLKRFGATSYTADEVEPRTLDRATIELVRGVGEALDLRCFGVDLRVEDARPVVVDANPFPGYRGFPDAVPALRFEIERLLGRTIR